MNKLWSKLSAQHRFEPGVIWLPHVYKGQMSTCDAVGLLRVRKGGLLCTSRSAHDMKSILCRVSMLQFNNLTWMLFVS